MFATKGSDKELSAHVHMDSEMERKSLQVHNDLPVAVDRSFVVKNRATSASPGWLDAQKQAMLLN